MKMKKILKFLLPLLLFLCLTGCVSDLQRETTLKQRFGKDAFISAQRTGYMVITSKCEVYNIEFYANSGTRISNLVRIK